jgi:hypothetical protein
MRDAGVKSPGDQLASSTGLKPVRRYGNSQGDGIAADRTACGAMGLKGAWLGQRG